MQIVLFIFLVKKMAFEGEGIKEHRQLHSQRPNGKREMGQWQREGCRQWRLRWEMSVLALPDSVSSRTFVRSCLMWFYTVDNEGSLCFSVTCHWKRKGASFIC